MRILYLIFYLLMGASAVLGQSTILEGKPLKNQSKLLLELNRPVDIPNGIIVLIKIDAPKTSIPGNRSIYYLNVSNIQPTSKATESIRFDPYNSGKEVSFKQTKLRIYTNPENVNSLLLEVGSEAGR